MSPRSSGWQGRKHRIGSFAAGFLLALAGMLPALPAAASTTTVGTIPGRFAVTATGAATYAIPIALPRGSGGLTPSLALVYNSQSGSGAAGWGWTLAGLSAITRCPKTIDDDQVTQAVQLQSTDDYCLDGQRLRITNGGAEGGNGTTYDTELRVYSLITSYTGSPTSGPNYWTVQTKNGTTYEYGNTTDSKILATSTSTVRVWALDKVTDANGNYYTISYQNNDTTTGDYWPLTIAYSGNNNKPSSPDHTVTFGWTPRSDTTVHTSFVAGTLVAQTQLLGGSTTTAGITVSYNGTTALSYYLVYAADPANYRNLLQSIQECAPDTSGSCLPPTNITWQEGAAGGWGLDTPVSSATVGDAAHAAAAHLMDVNGDGIQDLVYPGPNAHWMVMFGQVSGGLGNPVDTGINYPVGSTNYYQYALATDFNGDGKQDLMVPESDGYWHVLEATGSETADQIFNDVTTNLSDTVVNSQTNEPVYEGEAFFTDYYGHDLGDYVYSDGTNIYLQVNNGPNSNPQFGTPQIIGSVVPSSNFGTPTPTVSQYEFIDMPLDFDGSGRAGRLGLQIQDRGSATDYIWNELVPSASGYQSVGALRSSQPIGATQPVPIDANGDGITDLVWVNPTNGDAALYLGGMLDLGMALYGSVNDPVFADYYGDGRQELILYEPVGLNPGWKLIRANYSLGSNSFTTQTTALTASTFPYPSSEVAGSLRVGSIDAEGLDDLVYAVDNSGTYTWHYDLHNPPPATTGYPNTGGISDTVANITDGLGNSYTPSYAPLTSTSAYTEGSGAVYPVQDVKAPIAVVTSYSENDGISGQYTISYSYANGEQEVTGRGFLGFGTRSVTDSRNGVTATDDYSQTYPWIGALTSESVTQSNGEVLSTAANTYAPSAGCTGGVLCFPYLSQSIVTQNDASGNPLRTVTTANNSVDSYGDVTDRIVTIVDKTSGPTNGQTFTTETQTGYANDTSSGAYCIDLPTSVSITKTTPVGSLTRSSSSPRDTSSPSVCRPASVMLNSSGSPNLTTTYGYDDYGNPDSITVSGTNLTTRTTVECYGSYTVGSTTCNSPYYGEYPNQIINALGQSTEETWDPARGVETSMTDPNGHTTSWGYDGFGRRTSESQPSGLTLSWVYDACGATLNGQALGSPANCAYAVGETSNAQSLPVAATLYDAKARAIATESWLLGQAMSTVTTNYDALGRTQAVSKPYLSSPAYWTHTNYDVLNRPVQITGPAYQSDTASDCDVTSLVYSGFTTTATETAPTAPACGSQSTEQTVTTTDALGEIISKTDGSGTAQATTTYTYDPFGELHITKDADSNLTTINYDALGHKTKMIDPNMGTWTYTPDALGELLNQTDAKGQVIQQIFDVLGRLKSREECTATCSASTMTVTDTWNWDTATNGVGLLASESDTNGFQKAYTYDSLSRPNELDTTISGTTYAVDTGYDNFGRVATVTYPASVTPAASSAPTASASASPTTVVLGNSVTLTGSGTDPNGLPMQYSWSVSSGPGAGGIADSDEAITTFTPAVPGNYTLQLVVTDPNTASAPATVSITVQPLAPGAPSTAPNPSTTGSYTVSWNAVSGASSYELYESTNGTSYTDLGSVSGTSDPLSGRSDGSYYYKVSACENSVCGPLSAASSAESVLMPPPVPTGLSVSPNPSTTGSFTLSWNSAATATSYKAYSASTGLLGSSTTTSYPATAGDGTVNYYVTACNSSGCSGDSTSVSETVTLPPGTPSTPSASPNPSTTGNFTVTWSAPSGTWTSLQFQESPNQSSWTTEATSGTSWSGSGFGNGTYYFRTIYCDGTACSTSSTGSELVTLPPGAPTNLYGSPNPSTNGNYTLYWTAPSSGTVTSYNIYNSGGGYINSTTGTSASFGGIADGSYGYYVKACNQTACGSASNTFTETVLHIPGVPPSVSASPTSISVGGSFTLFWGTSSGSVGYYVAIGSGAGSTHYSPSTHLAVIYPGRTGTDLYYVQACNASGCSAVSNSATVTVSGGGGGKTPTPAPSASSGGGLTSALPNGIPQLGVPGNLLADTTANNPDTGNSITAALTQERQLFTAQQPNQLSESAMQERAARAANAALPSLLPPAPSVDVVAWNKWDKQWKRKHPNGPEFAPPEYIAWANAKLEPASGSPYRFEVQYNYDPQSGALRSVSNAQTGFMYWEADTENGTDVDAFGHLLAWTDGNNVSTVMAYDQATGAPVGISSGIGQSSAIQSLTYTWDGYGNLEERQDANQSNLYEKLTYDDLNRLSTSTVTNSANNGPTNDYQYDAMGDITTPTIAGTSETYNYDLNHPYAVDTVKNSSGTTLYSASYDADGNMITRNGYSIQWTVDNLPTSIASASGSSTFSYDPERQRYAQSATFNGNTTATAYIGGLFEVVSTSTTTEYRHNILADGQIVAVHTIDQSGNASTSYLHSDHLGSVDAITGDQGTVIQSMSFDAFGLRRDPSNWNYDLSQNTIATLKNYTDRGYTDQEELDNLSLVDLNGRIYDPTVGRMISADPTVPEPLYSQAFNRFAYVYDSPLVYVDPSGFSADPCPKTNAVNIGGGYTRAETVCLGKITVTGTPIGDNTNQPGGTEPNSTNTTSTPGNGQSNGSNNGNTNPGKNPKQPPQQKPPPQTTKCVVTGKSTGNGNNGVPGALPGVTVGPGNVAIDPAVLGLPTGPSTNQTLANYASQITISFSPPPPLPSGFPTTFTVGDVVGPAGARGQNPPIFDINGLPDLQSQYNVTGTRQVTITFPSSAPFTCSGS